MVLPGPRGSGSQLLPEAGHREYREGGAGTHPGEKDPRVGPEVGPTSVFCNRAPTGMHGPTYIFWASLTNSLAPADLEERQGQTRRNGRRRRRLGGRRREGFARRPGRRCRRRRKGCEIGFVATAID